MKKSRESRLPADFIEDFLQRHQISWSQVERGVPVWLTANGKVPLTMKLIEAEIGREDPVAWAWMNFREIGSYRNGEPWKLDPVQAEMARLSGDVVFECGSAVGKTRDLMLQAAHRIDSNPHGGSVMIVTNSAQTMETIWRELEFQISESKRLGLGAWGYGIGMGVKDSKEKPLRFKDFNNGFHLEMRICGDDGEQLRGAHIDDIVMADEVAKWKNPLQHTELWRSGNPGCKFRIYSTPDGDYSSPFCALSARSTAVGSTADQAESISAKDSGADADDGFQVAKRREFKKFWIPKTVLGDPFWNEEVRAECLKLYGAEDSQGWQTNVMGKWGDPEYSVFPFHRLKEVLRALPRFRMVQANVPIHGESASLTCARPTGGGQEAILTRIELDMAKLPEAIASWFPTLEANEIPYFGCDIGVDADPTEILCFIKGSKWTDHFRLNLKHASYTMQRDIITALDHASGHVAAWGIDAGAAGVALTEMITLQKFCVACNGRVFMGERLKAFSFSGINDAIDFETGRPLENPDKDGKPVRVSNKEFSTRVIERLVQEQKAVIAWDGGAGDPKLSGPQLMVNHTFRAGKKGGERFFKATDDHYIDARRQAVLSAVFLRRGQPFIPINDTTVATLAIRQGAASAVGFAPNVSAEFFGNGRRVESMLGDF